jgi:hypothetical protein
VSDSPDDETPAMGALLSLFPSEPPAAPPFPQTACIDELVRVLSLLEDNAVARLEIKVTDCLGRESVAVFK